MTNDTRAAVDKFFTGDRTGWEQFTFYYGTLTGYRYVASDGTIYEIVPTNGRTGYWDVIADDEWVGESFTSVDEAKAWVES